MIQKKNIFTSFPPCFCTGNLPSPGGGISPLTFTPIWGSLCKCGRFLYGSAVLVPRRIFDEKCHYFVWCLGYNSSFVLVEVKIPKATSLIFGQVETWWKSDRIHTPKRKFMQKELMKKKWDWFEGREKLWWEPESRTSISSQLSIAQSFRCGIKSSLTLLNRLDTCLKPICLTSAWAVFFQQIKLVIFEFQVGSLFTGNAMKSLNSRTSTRVWQQSHLSSQCWPVDWLLYTHIIVYIAVYIISTTWWSSHLNHLFQPCFVLDVSFFLWPSDVFFLCRLVLKPKVVHFFDMNPQQARQHGNMSMWIVFCWDLCNMSQRGLWFLVVLYQH